MIPSRQDTRHDDRVDHAPGSLSACHLKHNGKGRCTARAAIEVGVVVGDIEADDEYR